MVTLTIISLHSQFVMRRDFSASPEGDTPRRAASAAPVRSPGSSSRRSELPHIADRVAYDRYDFEIVDMDD